MRLTTANPCCEAEVETHYIAGWFGTAWLKRNNPGQWKAFTPMGDLQSPINLTCMFLIGGRKPENPEGTYTEERENMQTPHRKAP